MANSFKNKLLKLELEKYLVSKFTNVAGGSISKEAVFSHIMDTSRSYRADYYLPDHNIIIEVNGGQYSNGRHNRAGKVKDKNCTTYENDLNKINIAQKNGFKIYQFTYEMLARQEYKLIL